MKIKNKAAQELAKLSIIKRKEILGDKYLEAMKEMSKKGVKARKALNKAV
jgi:hypothetical protein